MGVWIKFVVFVCEPETTIGIENFLAEGREELFENPAPINTGSENMSVPIKGEQRRATYSSCPN